MRRLRPQEKKRVGEFRMLRGVPSEVNFSRFLVFVGRLKRRLGQERKSGPIAKYRLRDRRERRSQAAQLARGA